NTIENIPQLLDTKKFPAFFGGDRLIWAILPILRIALSGGANWQIAPDRNLFSGTYFNTGSIRQEE
ncbi:MAG: hypothetical protein KDK27_12795, partial [Leptospiraceae bacterium]|nr:hypothetical protein [Leptospiraceae bacterium]